MLVKNFAIQALAASLAENHSQPDEQEDTDPLPDGDLDFTWVNRHERRKAAKLKKLKHI